MRVGASIAVLAVLVAACGQSLQAEERSAPTYVVTANGRLDSESEARFLVAERDAVIRDVAVRPGRSVKAGDVIMELACEDAQARLESAHGAEASAEAQLELLETGPLASEIGQAEAIAAAEAARKADALDWLQREEALARRGYATERTLSRARREAEAQAQLAESARAALQRVREGARDEEKAAARALLEVAGARRREAAAEVAKCELRSPIDGTVLRVFRREGEFSGASQGAHLVVVADLRTMIVRAEIDERDAQEVRVGQKAEIWLDGRKERFAGTVTEVAALVGRRSARSLDPADRFDRETVEAIVTLAGEPVPRQVGLRVLVGIGEGEP